MLNKVTLMGTLAATPEMGLADDGREYCLFSFRIFLRNKDGVSQEDYIRPICYGDEAEYLVRDCDIGDTLLLDGGLAVSKWKDKRFGIEREAMNVVVDRIEKVASGNGTVPPPTLKDMESAVAIPFQHGEETNVSSITFCKQGTILKTKPLRHRFPQPLPDGTFLMPEGKPNKLVAKWLDDHGVSSVEYTLIVNANDLATQNAVSSKMLSEAKRYASMMVPFFLEPSRGSIRLPNRKFMKEGEYYLKVRRQHEFLAKQTPSFRQQIIAEAGKIGIVIQPWWYGVPAGQTKMAYVSFFDNEGRIIYPKTKKEVLENTVAAARIEASAAAEQTRIYQQTTDDDWYQDEKTGEWRMKRR